MAISSEMTGGFKIVGVARMKGGAVYFAGYLHIIILVNLLTRPVSRGGAGGACAPPFDNVKFIINC